MKNSTAVFPDIDYKYWLSRYDWNNLGTVPGMITTMKNWKAIPEEVTPQNITDQINLKINDYLKENDSSKLKSIFFYIQTWGGKSAGKHTKSIIQNWEKDSCEVRYLNFVKLVLNKESVKSYGYLQTKNGKITGLGPSFIAKHICFWSGKGDRINGLPILDNVIAKLIYATDESKKINYQQFISEFESFSQAKGMKSSEVEMALFAFSGHYWETNKTASKSFKPQIDNKSKDFEKANLIAERYSTNN